MHLKGKGRDVLYHPEDLEALLEAVLFISLTFMRHIYLF